MPMGIHSVLAEGGRQLSGSQRQRVMIARALVNRPRLLFFDHAMAALDNRTQAIIGESIAKISGTRLVVTNRLGALRDGDRIIVLEAARIVESGPYDELSTECVLFVQPRRLAMPLKSGRTRVSWQDLLHRMRQICGN